MKKNLHIIVANKVGKDLGFDSDDNSVEVFWPGGEQSFPLAAKSVLANDLVKLIAERFHEQSGSGTKTELPAIAVRD